MEVVRVHSTACPTTQLPAQHPHAGRGAGQLVDAALWVATDADGLFNFTEDSVLEPHTVVDIPAPPNRPRSKPTCFGEETAEERLYFFE